MLFEAIECVADPEPHDGAFNMAMDETLFLETAAPAIRVYGWSRPAVSFGYFERYAAAVETHPGREPVRRWTGGGIVPHGEDLTYSLFAPADSALARLKPSESYRFIHECILELLARVGVVGSVAAETGAGVSRACFEKAARHDILAGGKKIAGAAQRRTRSGLLHQGSIQNVALPRGFGDLLAAAFSRRVKTRELRRDETERAALLAREKYAGQAWLKRY